jgi:hypothetical protein
VKPAVKSGSDLDVTLTFTIRINDSPLGSRSSTSNWASAGSVRQPTVVVAAGAEASKPAASNTARASRLSHRGWLGAAPRRLIAPAVSGSDAFVGAWSGASGVFDGSFDSAPLSDVIPRLLKHASLSVGSSRERQCAICFLVAAKAIPTIKTSAAIKPTKQLASTTGQLGHFFCGEGLEGIGSTVLKPSDDAIGV